MPKTIIPYSSKEELLDIITQILVDTGKIKFDENDNLDFLINKIDTNTLKIENGKLTVIVNFEISENASYTLIYENDNDFIPKEIQKRELSNNSLLTREIITIDEDKDISKIEVYNNNEEKVETIEYRYVMNSNNIKRLESVIFQKN